MLDQLVHQLEARLLSLWQGDGRDERRADLTERIARVQAERDRLDAVRRQAAERCRRAEEAVARLPTLIESSLRRGKPAQAMRQALELDRTRRDLEADRRSSVALEQACWSLTFHLRQLRRELAQLHGRSS